MLIYLGFLGVSFADALLDTVEKELLRAQDVLFSQEDPAYWIGLEIHDTYTLELQAEEGNLYSYLNSLMEKN